MCVCVCVCVCVRVSVHWMQGVNCCLNNAKKTKKLTSPDIFTKIKGKYLEIL